jgi:hypothetical protein
MPAVNDLETIRDFIAVIHGARDLQRFPVKPWEIV